MQSVARRAHHFVFPFVDAEFKCLARLHDPDGILWGQLGDDCTRKTQHRQPHSESASATNGTHTHTPRGLAGIIWVS